MRIQLISAVAALAWLAGCAPVYSDSAGDFAKGVSDIKDASASLRQTYAGTQVLFYRVRRRLDHDTPVWQSACDPTGTFNDCYLTSKTEQARQASADRSISATASIDGLLVPAGPGVLEVSTAQVPSECVAYAQNSHPSPATAASDNPAAAKPPSEATILAALDDYGKGLAAITNKSDSDAYKTAASKLSTSVGALAGTIGGAVAGAGAAAGPILKAVIDIGTHLNLVRLENDRYQALKAAVLAACIPVSNLAYAEGTILVAERSIIIDRNEIVLGRLSAPATYFRSQPLNDADMEQAAAFLRGLGPDVSAAAIKIAATHRKLVEAVLTGKGQTDALLADIAAFASEAKALKDAVEGQKAKASSSAG